MFHYIFLNLFHIMLQIENLVLLNHEVTYQAWLLVN